MSTTPDPEIDLDLHFLPAWARQSPDVNRYVHFEGGGEDRSRRPGRGRRPDAPPRTDRPPRRAGGPGGPGGGGRPGERRGEGGPRGRERGGPVPNREVQVPLPELSVSFVPEGKGVESLARQIKVTGRAYPVFEIAQLVLSKPERYQVTFGELKNPEGQVIQGLWLCSIDNSLWLSNEEAIGHVMRRHFDMFYQAEKTPADPPKGTYTFVAQCGLSGTILGPPNYHDYQTKLHKLHASRFSRMPLEAYKSRIRIVRDEAVVKQWVDEQSWKTEYVCLNVPEPLKVANREEAEKHFRDVHAPSLIQKVESWTASAAVAQQLPNALLRQLLRRAWEEQRRFPLRVVTVLSQQLANHGLQFFKVNKTVTHVCVARPHFLDLSEAPVSEGVRRIVEHIQSHEGCSRRALVEALAPTPKPAVAEPAPPAEPPAPVPAEGTPGQAAAAAGTTTPAASAPVPVAPTPEQTAIVADLHWLIHQGHVIEFANGRLETAKKPKPKPVAPKPAAKPEAAVVQESAAGNTGEAGGTGAGPVDSISAESTTSGEPAKQQLEPPADSAAEGSVPGPAASESVAEDGLNQPTATVPGLPVESEDARQSGDEPGTGAPAAGM